jgi:hypothetical protein
MYPTPRPAGVPTRLLPVAPRVLLAALLLVGLAPLAAAERAPTIHLFPTNVLEDLKATGDAAREMEAGLQDYVDRLDQQQTLYLESKCQGAEGDPGCEQIARQMGAVYLEMLATMEARLPEMEEAVLATRASLERRLQTELGHKLTPWGLQEMLLGRQAGEASADARPALRGRAGMRLSERFRRYYELVAHSGTTDNRSVAVVAADIYLDMEEAAALIARTREEIARATLMEQLNQSFGLITPEMQEVVAGVKGILFGESPSDGLVAGAPARPSDQAYRSPLEL